jgi:hypothetical protein
VLKDCTWEVKKGERVGLVGEWGVCDSGGQQQQQQQQQQPQLLAAVRVQSWMLAVHLLL